MFTVELIYATLEKQNIHAVEVEIGASINDVIIKSGILSKHPEINLTINKVGIYNQVKKLEDKVNGKDRVEIYRTLIADPKEARRKRALKQKQEGIIN